jgi:hypothetical protein
MKNTRSSAKAALALRQTPQPLRRSRIACGVDRIHSGKTIASDPGAAPRRGLNPLDPADQEAVSQGA